MNIEAEFNYRKPLKENEAKPAYGKDNESEDKNTMPDFLKPFKKTVHNARESDFDIMMGGFELINHISSVQDFYNDEEVVSVYYEEMASHVKEKVGEKSKATLEPPRFILNPALTSSTIVKTSYCLHNDVIFFQ